MNNRNSMRTFSALVLSAFTFAAYTQSISTTGSFTFNPSLLTVQAGTPISLSIGGAHTMTEVSESTWNMNGTTSNGGFNYDGGNHILTLDIPGTYYYVCVPHAGMGMKGRIIVESSTGVEETNDNGDIMIFPNPANDGMTISMPGSNGMRLRLIDMQGREVHQQLLTGNDRVATGQLAKGHYTVVIQDADGSQVARRPLTITR